MPNLNNFLWIFKLGVYIRVWRQGGEGFLCLGRGGEGGGLKTLKLRAEHRAEILCQRTRREKAENMERAAEDAEKMERERERRRKPERERSGPPPPPELLPSSPRPEAGRQRERSSREQRRAPLTRPTHGSQHMKYHTHMKYYTYMNFMS